MSFITGSLAIWRGIKCRVLGYDEPEEGEEHGKVKLRYMDQVTGQLEENVVSTGKVASYGTKLFDSVCLVDAGQYHDIYLVLNPNEYAINNYYLQERKTIPNARLLPWLLDMYVVAAENQDDAKYKAINMFGIRNAESIQAFGSMYFYNVLKTAVQYNQNVLKTWENAIGTKATRYQYSDQLPAFDMVKMYPCEFCTKIYMEMIGHGDTGEHSTERSLPQPSDGDDGVS